MEDSLSVASKLSILICLFIVYFYQINVQYFKAEYYTSFTIGAVRFAFSFMQLIFTVLFIFYWYELRLWKEMEMADRSSGG